MPVSSHERDDCERWQILKQPATIRVCNTQIALFVVGSKCFVIVFAVLQGKTQQLVLDDKY